MFNQDIDSYSPARIAGPTTIPQLPPFAAIIQRRQELVGLTLAQDNLKNIN